MEVTTDEHAIAAMCSRRLSMYHPLISKETYDLWWYLLRKLVEEQLKPGAGQPYRVALPAEREARMKSF